MIPHRPRVDLCGRSPRLLFVLGIRTEDQLSDVFGRRGLVGGS